MDTLRTLLDSALVLALGLLLIYAASNAAAWLSWLARPLPGVA